MPHGIRRIARGQLDGALESITAGTGRDRDEAVHEVRKSLKRVRALLRLARATLGEETYRRENAALRETARRLSGLRDAAVLATTLNDLAERYPDELTAEAMGGLHERLQREYERSFSETIAVAEVRDDLLNVRARTAEWTLAADGFAAVGRGLKRLYGRGRRSLRSSAAEPTTEQLHEWRKRVKQLWHAVEVLERAAPKRMRKLARRVHRLSDLLGLDHDLAVLRTYAEERPDCFSTQEALGELLAVVDRRRTELQRDALQLGGQLYAHRPKRFVRSVEQGWRKRAARSRQAG